MEQGTSVAVNALVRAHAESGTTRSSRRPAAAPKLGQRQSLLKTRSSGGFRPAAVVG